MLKKFSQFFLNAFSKKAQTTQSEPKFYLFTYTVKSSKSTNQSIPYYTFVEWSSSPSTPVATILLRDYFGIYEDSKFNVTWKPSGPSNTDIFFAVHKGSGNGYEFSFQSRVKLISMVPPDIIDQASFFHDDGTIFGYNPGPEFKKNFPYKGSNSPTETPEVEEQKSEVDLKAEKEKILEQLYDLDRSDDPHKKERIVELKQKLKQIDPNANYISYLDARKARLVTEDDIKPYMKNLEKDRPDENYNPEQLNRGIEVEMEHTSDPTAAKEIAKDHLDEVSDYYTKLDKYVEAQTTDPDYYYVVYVSNDMGDKFAYAINSKISHDKKKLIMLAIKEARFKIVSGEQWWYINNTELAFRFVDDLPSEVTIFVSSGSYTEKFATGISSKRGYGVPVFFDSMGGSPTLESKPKDSESRSNEILEQVYDAQGDKSVIEPLKEEYKKLNPGKPLPTIFSRKVKLSNRKAQIEPVVDKDDMRMWLENDSEFYHWMLQNVKHYSQIPDFINKSHNDPFLTDKFKQFLSEIREYHESSGVNAPYDDFTEAAKEAAVGFFENQWINQGKPTKYEEPAPSVQELHKLMGRVLKASLEQGFELLYRKISAVEEEMESMPVNEQGSDNQKSMFKMLGKHLDDASSMAYQLWRGESGMNNLIKGQEADSSPNTGDVMDDEGNLDTSVLASPDDTVKKKKKKKGQADESKFYFGTRERTGDSIKHFLVKAEPDIDETDVVNTIRNYLYPNKHSYGQITLGGGSRNVSQHFELTDGSHVSIVVDNSPYSYEWVSRAFKKDFLARTDILDINGNQYGSIDEILGKSSNLQNQDPSQRSNQILEEVYDLQGQEGSKDKINTLKEEYKKLNPNQSLPTIFSKKLKLSSYKPKQIRLSQYTTEDTLRQDITEKPGGYMYMGQLFDQIQEHLQASIDLLNGISANENPEMYKSWVGMFGDDRGIDNTKQNLFNVVRWIEKLKTIPQLNGGGKEPTIPEVLAKIKTAQFQSTVYNTMEEAIQAAIEGIENAKSGVSHVYLNASNEELRAIAQNILDRIGQVAGNVNYLSQLMGGISGIGSQAPSLYPKR